MVDFDSSNDGKLGSFRVWIRDLTYEKPTEESRQLDQRNVLRLKNIYKTEGCHHDHPRNAVPALIDGETFKRVLRNPDASRALMLHHPLTFLHGRHRVEAAKAFLDPLDSWWTVDLYPDRMYISSQGKDEIEMSPRLDRRSKVRAPARILERCWVL